MLYGFLGRGLGDGTLPPNEAAWRRAARQERFRQHLPDLRDVGLGRLGGDGMNAVNEMKLSFPSKSCNEAFARSVTAAFVMHLDPTVNELSDLKTAVSEAVTNCIVHNVVGDAIFLQRTKAQFFNSQISNAGNNCVTVVGGTTRFYHCTVAQFYPWNAEHGAALLFTNNMDNVVYPLHLIEFTNSIITGYADDELFGSRMEDSDATFNYRFVNSLINTVITDEESVNFPNCRFEPRLKDISDLKEEEQPVNRATQFRLVDTDIYLYDFQLDTLSTARQLGDGTLVPEPCKNDLRGIPRPTDKPDAGCYQFVE